MKPKIINNTREVNCIIEQGVRYCEKPELTKFEGGMILIGIAVYIMYFTGVLNLCEREDWDMWIRILLIFVLPLLILGGVLLI